MIEERSTFVELTHHVYVISLKLLIIGNNFLVIEEVLLSEVDLANLTYIWMVCFDHRLYLSFNHL